MAKNAYMRARAFLAKRGHHCWTAGENESNMHKSARTFQYAAGKESDINTEADTRATNLRVAGSERRCKHSSSATKLCMCVGVHVYVCACVCVCVCVCGCAYAFRQDDNFAWVKDV